MPIGVGQTGLLLLKHQAAGATAFVIDVDVAMAKLVEHVDLLVQPGFAGERSAHGILLGEPGGEVDGGGHVGAEHKIGIEQNGGQFLGIETGGYA